MPEALATGAGTVLAFDFGTKRIGIAIGEFEVRMAHPLVEIAAEETEPRFAAIAKLIEQWRPQLLVVGLPLSAAGEPYEFTRRAERFARQLQGRFGMPVSLVDERYTSVDAEAGMRSAGAPKAIHSKKASAHRAIGIDSMSAQLILQQYFDDHPA